MVLFFLRTQSAKETLKITLMRLGRNTYVSVLTNKTKNMKYICYMWKYNSNPHAMLSRKNESLKEFSQRVESCFKVQRNPGSSVNVKNVNSQM